MSDVSPRVATALRSRADATNDFFGGWEASDVELLGRWRADLSGVAPQPGELIDWLGGRTLLENHAWLPVPPEGWIVVDDLPIPDDQVHAEAIEYVALVNAIETAQQRGGRTFSVLELGASYAPWTVSAGRLALRAGFERVVLRPVEASATAIGRIHAHAALNGLADDARVDLRVTHAAVSTNSKPLYFPRVDTRADNGAQATSKRRRTDYRGVGVEYDRVEGVTLDDVCRGIDRVDYVHLDLQGAEQALLEDGRFVRTASARIATMLLATQSRLIEGIALRVLSEAGWSLLRERPTAYVPNPRTADINGWTVRDGAQIWRNDRLA